LLNAQYIFVDTIREKSRHVQGKLEEENNALRAQLTAAMAEQSALLQQLQPHQAEPHQPEPQAQAECTAQSSEAAIVVVQPEDLFPLHSIPEMERMERILNGRSAGCYVSI